MSRSKKRMADPQKGALSGIGFLVSPPSLDRIAALLSPCLVWQFLFPGWPLLSHDPDLFCLFRKFIERIVLQVHPLLLGNRSGHHQRSPVAQHNRQHQPTVLALLILLSDNSQSGPDRVLYHLTMFRSLQWLLPICARLCQKVNAQYRTAPFQTGQGVQCWGLKLQEVGALQNHTIPSPL